MIELDRIEELARMASTRFPLPWRTEYNADRNEHEVRLGEKDAAHSGVLLCDYCDQKEMGAYLTATSPERILAVIARLREAEAGNERLRALLRRHFPRAPDATDEDVEQAIREELEAMRGDVHD